MKQKQVCLIVQPRDGLNTEHLDQIEQIFREEGWQPTIEISKYDGHAITLATNAVHNDADLIVAYGGDGTLNATVNGVMQAGKKSQHSAVAVLPGGTVNLWATEMGLPMDAVEAAHIVATSTTRPIDIVRFAVRRVQLSNNYEDQGSEEQPISTEERRHHFLLMAGMGIDAAVLNEAKQNLKQQFGVFAINVATVTTLPQQRPFSLKVETVGSQEAVARSWEGDAFQVVIGNTRRRANDITMTPQAYVNDGLIDACIITAESPMGVIQQVISLLTRQQPDEANTEFLRGKQISITLPASVSLQVDGDIVEVCDYMSDVDREWLKQPEQLERSHLTYHFQVLPLALNVAVPTSYQGDLFKPAL